MDLALVRTEFRPDGIFSEFRSAGGEMLFTCLEHAYADGLGAWLPKVPDGVYNCKRYFSPSHEYEVFEVMDVPGCTFIEIHIGNYNRDSEGCLLVGLGIAQISGAQMITQSGIAFKSFMTIQNGLDSFTLTVTSS